ncbi:unnamed protein product [Adineta ricciae]|uniref:DET1- and DDB1-associated protein 1 domain-containing protein n=1 Tax=Adineta ricciae TaxID=249248 RepID=A0A814JS38_ADIRI|nr:unnamed protein product [Adineta ricciae]
MSSFLKDLPCRNPSNFTRIQATGAIRQISVRPTYTARLDSNAQGIETIDEHSSRLQHFYRFVMLTRNNQRSSFSSCASFILDTSKKQTRVEDGSEVPIALSDQTELATQSATITNHRNEDLC